MKLKATFSLLIGSLKVRRLTKVGTAEVGLSSLAYPVQTDCVLHFFRREGTQDSGHFYSYLYSTIPQICPPATVTLANEAFGSKTIILYLWNAVPYSRFLVNC